MTAQLRIESLTKIHNRTEFDCGNQALNTFLQTTARQHNDKGLSKTFVLCRDNNQSYIIGYMTLVVCEVLADDIPHTWQKKYPRRIPAAKLAKLAISSDYQQQGYGEILLIDAIQKTLTASKSIGLSGLFVDAKDKQAKAYYQRFGFIALAEQLNNLFIPLATLQNLSLK